jgi:hypothetical protein
MSVDENILLNIKLKIAKIAKIAIDDIRAVDISTQYDTDRYNYIYTCPICKEDDSYCEDDLCGGYAIYPSYVACEVCQRSVDHTHFTYITFCVVPSEFHGFPCHPACWETS